MSDAPIVCTLAAALVRGPVTFVSDPRFSTIGAPDAIDPSDDPAAAAFREGYTRGVADAEARALAQAECDASARGRIEAAFERLSEAETLRLEERLRETVLALCETAMAPLALDADALSERIARALALLRRAEDQRTLRLNPEDLALIGPRLPEHLRVEPDPSLPRGSLRIETDEGGVEDGPGQWRRALADVLDL